MNVPARGFLLLGLVAIGFGVAIVLPRAQASEGTPQPKATPCMTSKACLNETNHGMGSAILGVSLGTTGGKFGSGALVARSQALGGIYSYSKQFYAGEFESDSQGEYTLIVAQDTPNSPTFLSEGPAGESISFDSNGNGEFAGAVFATNFVIISTSRGSARSAFGMESTRSAIEDTGTVRMTNGMATVRFDSAFAQTIDAGSGYQVFLTPDGQTRGWLFVAEKYEGGFVVREAMGGRSSVAFDYRIVAKPSAGASNARLPVMHLPNPPMIPRQN
jgi:hypothetical protein